MRAFHYVPKFHRRAIRALGLDGQAQLGADPGRHLLAIDFQLPLFRRVAVHGLRTKAFTNRHACGSTRVGRVHRIHLGRAHTAGGIGRHLHIHLLIGHERVDDFFRYVHDHDLTHTAHTQLHANFGAADVHLPVHSSAAGSAHLHIRFELRRRLRPQKNSYAHQKQEQGNSSSPSIID